MKGDRVLVSTHDLPRAGALRQGFQKAGYPTELVTPAERLTKDSSVALLVLTGGFQEDQVPELARQAHEELHVPIFAISESDEHVRGRRPGYEEVFTRSASVEDIVLLGRRVIERQRLREITGIVGETDAMYQVLERVVQIAPVGSTVLVTGESGTGKELVARGIHALSPRRHKPFIAVNVAAISQTLIESEIFGHEKGAFTGAMTARKGLFELADGGTIFLDEIGDMPLATQTKLLRVLEQREFHRVGGEVSIKVDVRIVAATNQDLRHFVAIGQFRRDLYFRLNVLNIELPALRERRADIPLLVESFVREVSDHNDRVFPGISPAAMELLTAYSWPGNIRELRNLVESMVVLAPGRAIRPEDLPDDVRGGRGVSLLPVPSFREPLEDVGVGRLRPELEFVFRTLVELRVDMDDLRRDFDVYRTRGSAHGSDAIVGRVGSGEPLSGIDVEGWVEIPSYAPSGSVGEVEPPRPAVEENVVVFRPGMTMDEIERLAIATALKDVQGNRRKAAELLGIGERTLYRKISKYGLEA
ncbi:MAG: sigma-54 dependent transcriptional regulator [Gemmatimonadetes bacterium]|nr:sigma-54 dependent transcriptional regulator [Gemmatimonadota bacterium]MDA1103749.1 sigma-54 dependent transcriptional regulator [Gemmatimonadota bacterium]